MTKNAVSAPNLMKGLDTERKLVKANGKKLQSPAISPRSTEANKENAEPRKKRSSLPQTDSKRASLPPAIEKAKTSLELPKPQIKKSDETKSESAVPVPSGLTPIRRSLEKVAIEDNQSDLEKSKCQLSGISKNDPF